MIVDMKKVTVLALASREQEALEELRTMGLLHVTPVLLDEGANVEQAERRLADLDHIRNLLSKHANTRPTGIPSEQLVDRLRDLDFRVQDARAREAELAAEEARVAPLGEFDPAELKELKKRNLHIDVYELGRQSLPEDDDGAWEVVSDTGKARMAARVHQGSASAMDFKPVEPPSIPLSELRQELASVRTEIETLERKMAEHAGDRPHLDQRVQQARDDIDLERARAGSGKSGPLVYLTGFAPHDKLAPFEQAAEQNGWGIVITKPEPSDSVPTLVRNPAWVRPIQVVFDFINVTPGYRELDISSVFLVFFGVFFAMIVGDAGYGLLFLAATLGARFALPDAPRPVIRLMLMMSVSTLLFGAVSGNWFGMVSLADRMSALRIQWLTDESNVMLLCFLLGAVHITIAHAWRAVLYGRHPKALAQVGWIASTWGMFFLARHMVLNEPLPGFTAPLIGAAVLMVALFMTPMRKIKSEWFNHVMLPLDVINNFVDVVSYVRLFAVGMATFAMASAFNAMAADLAGDAVGFVVAGMVLFIGHTLNILLAMMGVLVHGVRLNTLEFSGHLGMEWTGFRYAPLKKSTSGL